MLNRDKIVLEPLGFVFGFGEQAVETTRDVDPIGRASRRRDLRNTVEFLLDPAMNLVWLHACSEKQGGHETVFLFYKSGDQVLDVDLLVTQADCFRLGCLDGLLESFGESVEVHGIRRSSSGKTTIAY